VGAAGPPPYVHLAACQRRATLGKHDEEVPHATHQDLRLHPRRDR
jgi:hypothetical protein